MGCGAGNDAGVLTVPPFDGRHLLVERVADEERVVESVRVHAQNVTVFQRTKGGDAHMGQSTLIIDVAQKMTRTFCACNWSTSSVRFVILGLGVKSL